MHHPGSAMPSIAMPLLILCLFCQDRLAGAEPWAATAVVRGKDPAEQARAVAVKLKEQCRGRTPDLVLLFDIEFGTRSLAAKQALLAGVQEHFDGRFIYGCSSHAWMFTGQEHGYVAMAALGGGFTVSAAKGKAVPGREEEAYVALAGEIREPYQRAAGSGRLLLLLGSALPEEGEQSPHEALASSAGRLLTACTTVLGEDAAVFGSITPGNPRTAAPETVKHTYNYQYFRGEIVDGGVVAVLLSGPFRVGTALAAVPAEARQGDPNRQEADLVLRSAEAAMRSALAAGGEGQALLAMADTCYTRGHSLIHAKRGREEGTLLGGLAGMPLLGIGNELQIGRQAGGPLQAVTDHINICLLRHAAR